MDVGEKRWHSCWPPRFYRAVGQQWQLHVMLRWRGWLGMLGDVYRGVYRIAKSWEDVPSIVVICESFVAGDFLLSKLEWSCRYWRQVFSSLSAAKRERMSGILRSSGFCCLKGDQLCATSLVSRGMTWLDNIAISITCLQDFVTLSHPPKVKKWRNAITSFQIARLHITTLNLDFAFFHWNNMLRT